MEKAFNGIVKNIILACAILLGAVQAHAYAPTHYAAQSALASGHWVKIKVDTVGIYQISYSQLREWGFSDPSKVRVYGRGPAEQVAQQFNTNYGDDLRPGLTLHQDNKLLFYGEGPIAFTIKGVTTNEVAENYYDNNNYYFLHQESGKVADTASPYVSTGTDASFNAYGVQMHKFNVQNPLRGGALFQGKRLENGGVQTMEFEYSSYDLEDEYRTGYIGYEYGVFRSSGMASPALVPSLTGDATMEDRVSDENINTLSEGSATVYSQAKGWRNFKPSAANGKFTFSLAAPEWYDGDYMAVDMVYMVYPLLLDMSNRNSLYAHFVSLAKNRRLRFENAPANLEVWSVGVPSAQQRFQVNYVNTENAAYVSAPVKYDSSSSPAKIVAFNPSAQFPTVEFVQTVANQNIHGMETPDMLIVTTTSLLPQAQELASIHERLQGMRVAVVDQELAFNEFSGGARHPQGIRRMAKMFYDRSKSDGSNRFRHILLYGASTFDNRFINIAPQELLVSFQAERRVDATATTSNYVGDQYFTFLEDNYQPDLLFMSYASICGGRLSVRNPSQAHKVNQKIERFLTNPTSPSAMERALFMSDDGDSDLHFVHNKVALDSIRDHQGITVSRIDNAAYPRPGYHAVEAQKAVKDAFMRGMSYLGYSGHGQHTSLSLKFMWGLDNVSSTYNKDYPFAMLSTCDTYDFDVKGGSILEEMVLKPDGGCIAGVGAARAVMLSLNKTLSVAMSTVYANAQPGDTYGDLLRKTRNRLVDQNFGEDTNLTPTAAGVNTMCYNFCGDPALPIPLAEYKVKFNPINGKALPDSYAEDFTNYPLVGVNAPFTLSASIVDKDGNPVSLSGTAIIEVYQPRSRRNMPGMETVKNFTIIIEDEQLATIPATITNGQLEVTIALPGNNYAGETDYNKIVVSVQGQDGKRATGWGYIKMDADNETPYGDDAPQIAEFYINTPDFTNGTIVEASSMVYATIKPGVSGLALSTLGVNNAPKCLLDGSVDKTTDISGSFDADGNYIITLPLNDIPDGNHTLTLNVSSFGGASESASLDFIVVSDCGSAELFFENDGVARTSADFSAVHTYGDNAVGRLIITNSMGRTVFSVENPTFPYSWNLKDNNGQLVPDGAYRANIILKAEQRHGQSEHLDFVVIKE